MPVIIVTTQLVPGWSFVDIWFWEDSDWFWEPYLFHYECSSGKSPNTAHVANYCQCIVSPCHSLQPIEVGYVIGRRRRSVLSGDLTIHWQFRLYQWVCQFVWICQFIISWIYYCQSIVSVLSGDLTIHWQYTDKTDNTLTSDGMWPIPVWCQSIVSLSSVGYILPVYCQLRNYVVSVLSVCCQVIWQYTDNTLTSDWMWPIPVWCQPIVILSSVKSALLLYCQSIVRWSCVVSLSK